MQAVKQSSLIRLNYEHLNQINGGGSDDVFMEILKYATGGFSTVAANFALDLWSGLIKESKKW